MARTTLEKTMRRWVLVVACVPLVLLTGCPQESAGAPGKAAPQSTAPTNAAGRAASGAAGGAASAAPSASSSPAPGATPVTAPQAVDNATKAYKVQQLIAAAEKAYRSGVANYGAGRLDAARLDFDTAIDLMLTSGMDLKADAQLADEFTHLLDAVNSLEMSALKQGNGFSPVLEAAPLDAANEVTFPPNAELTAKVAAELKTTQSDFPLVVNDYVAGFISYFSNSPGGHAHLLRSLERAGKYKEMIQRNLRAEGVPQDLIYLAVAESGFQPQALNAKSGAGGMWQFMPTGAYGLARNGWFDERFDPDKSSKAYAKYMKSLYNQFGDWYLAMAAYDWGPGYVQRAVMKTGYADFWELYKRNVLPAETKNYVPGIIAAIIMAKNPEQYGLANLVPEAPVISDVVSVDYPIDLRLVADVTGSPLQEIVALNPSLLRMTTPRDMLFDLHVPVGTKDAFLDRIKEIPEDRRASWRFHVVKPGETLDGIALGLHAKPSEIATVNDISVTQGVGVGDELVVPVATVVNGARMQRYTVRKDDTLVTVADRFNVSVDELRRWNKLKASTVKAGQVLSVAAPIRLAPVTHVRAKKGKSGAASRSGAKSAAKASTKSGGKSSAKSAGHGSNAKAGSSAAGSSAQSASASTKKKTHAAR
jgi:membrane-bound lytic murein transglycosylase D